MEKKKTLKEKIAEAGRSDNFTCTLCNLLMDDYGCTREVGTGCRESLADMLCDAIDREYIERPLFEDGEPVQKGDEYKNRIGKTYKVTTCSIDLDGSFDLYGKNGIAVDTTSFQPCEHVKRPESELFDADGMPIKVCDTVWHVSDGTEYTVCGLITTGYKCVSVRESGCDFITTIDAQLLTHKWPDCLERIENDSAMEGLAYWGCAAGDFSCKECPALIDGKTPWEYYGVNNCGRAMARDLLARQRAVLERDAR